MRQRLRSMALLEGSQEESMTMHLCDQHIEGTEESTKAMSVTVLLLPGQLAKLNKAVVI